MKRKKSFEKDSKVEDPFLSREWREGDERTFLSVNLEGFANCSLFLCRSSLAAACVLCAFDPFRILPAYTCCAVYFRLNKMPSVVDNGFIADF